MMAELRQRGLHPYRKHVGVRYLPGCTECFGRRCARATARWTGGRPASSRRWHRARRGLDRCEVVALRGSAGRVDAVEARARRRDAAVQGEAVRARGRRAELAAPAARLRRRALAGGCANGSGLVGRNLMFQLSERFAIWPAGPASRRTPPVRAAVSLRDFYQRDGVRFGHVHADGPRRVLWHHRAPAEAAVRPPRRRAGAAGPARLLRVPAFPAARRSRPRADLQGPLEDMPLPENRVDPRSGGPGADPVRVHACRRVAARRSGFPAMLRKASGPARIVLPVPRPELNLSHCCGTLRFGSDPATSVLDPACRAHEVDNLHVADGSFMPTSTGINPSLTIAANALRVADSVAAALGLGAARRAEPCDRNQPLPG